MIEVGRILIFFVAGIFIATVGSMTGLGGGFLCVPFLVIAWKLDRPEAVLISLTMILANSSSSSVSYVRSKMVDFKVVLLLSLFGIPALFIGYLLLESMETHIFDLLFAILLIAVTTYILISRINKTKKGKEEATGTKERGKEKNDDRRLIPHFSIPLSFLAGLVSSAFGIGGGAILMPLQVGLLKMNVKRAVATSMFIIMLMTGVRVFVISGGAFEYSIGIPMALGAILGAQIGARIVKRIEGQYILYILASFLFFISIFMGSSAIIHML